jgi:hypothetical protein
MKYLKSIAFAIMSYVALMFPIQQQNTSMCCVSCAMKKEDEIELEIDTEAHVQ